MHTFVLPARNEQATIGAVLSSVKFQARACELDFQIVVVDDGSTDNTAQLSMNAGARVVNTGGIGLAGAFKAGLAAAVELSSEYIIHVDSDGQYDLSDLPILLGASARNRLVIGNWLHQQPVGMSERRFAWNGYLSNLVSDFADTRVPDSQSGFRIFHADIARSVPIKSVYTYTQEQIIRASRQGIEIHQPPIAFGPRRDGQSRLMTSGLDYLWQVFRDMSSLMRELETEA